MRVDHLEMKQAERANGFDITMEDREFLKQQDFSDVESVGAWDVEDLQKGFEAQLEVLNLL